MSQPCGNAQAAPLVSAPSSQIGTRNPGTEEARRTHTCYVLFKTPNRNQNPKKTDKVSSTQDATDADGRNELRS